MDSCRRIRQQFDERLDGVLAAGLAAEFDRHLVGCDACRGAWQAYSGSWQALGKLSTVAPSVGFAERTLRQLAERPAPQRGVSEWPVWRWVALASVALLLGGGGWFGWKRKTAADQARGAALAEAYVRAQAVDYLEDFDVIASLHQLELNGSSHL